MLYCDQTISQSIISVTCFVFKRIVYCLIKWYQCSIYLFIFIYLLMSVKCLCSYRVSTRHLEKKESRSSQVLWWKCRSFNRDDLMLFTWNITIYYKTKKVNIWNSKTSHKVTQSVCWCVAVSAASWCHSLSHLHAYM